MPVLGISDEVLARTLFHFWHFVVRGHTVSCRVWKADSVLFYIAAKVLLIQRQIPFQLSLLDSCLGFLISQVTLLAGHLLLLPCRRTSPTTGRVLFRALCQNGFFLILTFLAQMQPVVLGWALTAGGLYRVTRFLR